MKILKSDHYTLISIEESTFKEFKKQLTDFKSNHVILELSKNFNINDEKISLLLRIFSDFKTNGLSFVVVKLGIDIDNFPESLNIAPTLQEAEDILEMEAIERDLGF